MAQRKPDSMSTLQRSIAAKRRQQRRLMFKRLLIVFLSLTMLVSIVAFFIWYEKSDYSKIQKIEVVGHKFLTKEEIIEDLDLELGQRIYTQWPSSIEKRVDTNSLLASVKVNRKLFEQTIQIIAKEKEVLAYSQLNDQQFKVFAGDTSSKIFNNDAKDLKSDLIYLNVNDSELSNSVVLALSEIDPVILKSVAEVSIKPISYDPTQIQLTMSGGYFIYSSLNGLDTFKASYYQDIINQLQNDPEMRCLEVDKFINQVRAFRCPKDELESPTTETDSQ